MEEEKLRQMIARNHGVYLDETLTKDQILDWLEDRRSRLPFLETKYVGDKPEEITPRPEDEELELIKISPTLLLTKIDRPRLVYRPMNTTYKLPPIGGLVPVEQIKAVEDEDFSKADGKNDDDDPIIPPRQGLLEDIIDQATRARQTNVRATFQPKTIFLPAPTLTRPRAKVVASTREKLAGERGVSLVPPSPGQRSRFELSRPGQRVEIRASEVTEEDFINPEKIGTGRGSYSVEELRSFLENLDLSTKGTKAELVSRLKEALDLS